MREDEKGGRHLPQYRRRRCEDEKRGQAPRAEPVPFFERRESGLYADVFFSARFNVTLFLGQRDLIMFHRNCSLPRRRDRPSFTGLAMVVRFARLFECVGFAVKMRQSPALKRLLFHHQFSLRTETTDWVRSPASNELRPWWLVHGMQLSFSTASGGVIDAPVKPPRSGSSS